jgi:hypothetical protein
MKKKCFKCKKTKDIELFYKHPKMGDGHLGKCKTCAKKDVNERYQSPEARERIREYERLRFKDPERKKKIRLYSLKRKKLHPRKARANQLVSNYLRNGRLKRMPCIVCGNEKSQAHHKDYRKPLSITWLCFKHHREEHGQKIT